MTEEANKSVGKSKKEAFVDETAVDRYQNLSIWRACHGFIYLEFGGCNDLTE